MRRKREGEGMTDCAIAFLLGGGVGVVTGILLTILFFVSIDMGDDK